MTTFADIRAAMTSKIEYSMHVRNHNGTVHNEVADGRSSWFHSGGMPGGTGGASQIPTTGALTYTGAFGYQSVAHPSAASHIVECHQRGYGHNSTILLPTGAFVIDRLAHTSGLSGTVTTAQTTNLPTPALTRYTTGAGVRAAVQIYTSLGGTATVATCSYTNQAGVAGRIGTIPSTSNMSSGNFFTFGLQSGDTGVRSVESVTLSASTGTVGDFGVVLHKPICTLPAAPYSDVTSIVGWNNPIDAEAVVEVLTTGPAASGGYSTMFVFGFTTAF